MVSMNAKQTPDKTGDEINRAFLRAAVFGDAQGGDKVETAFFYLMGYLHIDDETYERVRQLLLGK